MQNSSAGKHTPTASKGAFDPWLLWVAFRKHWGWVLPLGVILATVAGSSVWYSFVPEYEATHILEANRDYVLSQTVGSATRDLSRSERQLITNAIVLDPVLANDALKLAPSLADPATAERRIREQLQIGNAGTENLLTISYRETDKEMAAAVCNAIAESYLQVRRRFDDDRMGNVERWLAQPIEQWKRNVENLRATLSDLTRAAQGYDPFKATSALANDASKIGEIRSTLANLQAEETILVARLKVLESQEEPDINESALDPLKVEEFVANDRQVQKIKVSISDVEEKIRQLERRGSAAMWEQRYQTWKEDLKRLEGELALAEEQARQQARGTIVMVLAEQSAASKVRLIQDLKTQLANIRARAEAVASDYDAEKQRLEKLGGETAEIFFAREDYEQAAAILGQLNNRLAVLRTERGRGSSVSTMAAAKPPSWPIEEIPIKKIALAAIATFFMPFALAVLIEFLTKRLTSSRSIDFSTDRPVLGEIVKIPGGRQASRNHRLFEESIDAMRANLLFKLEGVRSIAVVSAMSSEGKSSVASQLAISLAKVSQSTVLLIDADLRSPDQHDLFGLNNELGLCGLLSGQASLENCIDKSLGDLLHVLPAGVLKSNPHNLLTKENMQRLLEDLGDSYRYVVIDTAPVLPAAETLSVSATCDATLLCAMRDVSRNDHVHRTLRRLDASGANIIGTVFSGVPAHQYAYRYGDYRYSSAKRLADHAHA